MFASFKKKYFLSNKGVSALSAGIFWTCVTNLVTMSGMAFLLFVMDGFVKHLTENADLPNVVPFCVGLAVFFVALLFSNWQQYYYTYCIFTRNAATSVSKLQNDSVSSRFRFSGDAILPI